MSMEMQQIQQMNQCPETIDLDVCYVCFEGNTDSSTLISSPCGKCKYMIHQECLQSCINKSNKNKCSICNSQYPDRYGTFLANQAQRNSGNTQNNHNRNSVYGLLTILLLTMFSMGIFSTMIFFTYETKEVMTKYRVVFALSICTVIPLFALNVLIVIKLIQLFWCTTHRHIATNVTPTE